DALPPPISDAVVRPPELLHPASTSAEAAKMTCGLRTSTIAPLIRDSPKDLGILEHSVDSALRGHGRQAQNDHGRRRNVAVSSQFGPSAPGETSAAGPTQLAV